MLKIIFLLGTARTGRQSAKIADFVLQVAKTRTDLEPIFVDVADHLQTHTNGDTKNSPWEKMLETADGLVIISPEYNHGYPGELKIFLDSAKVGYRGKPVGICGVSNGPIGGARMAEQLKLVLSNFQMMVINAAVYFANVDELLAEPGKLKNEEFFTKRVNGMLDELVKYS